MASPFTARYTKLHRLLRDVRLEAGLTQVQLAKRLHKPQSYISKIEQFERRVDVIEFLDIMRAIGLDPAAFLRRLP